MATVIPLRAFENALRQAAKHQAAPDRRRCVREVLLELDAGGTGYGVAARLQRERLEPFAPTDGAA